MGFRKCKCQECGEMILSIDDKYVYEYTSSKGNLKKVNLHKHCVESYDNKRKQIDEDNLWWDRLYQYILLNIYHYDKGDKLPLTLVNQLQDLRNGTTITKSKGREVASKEGYPYKVILNTFLICGERIRESFKIKQFKNQTQQINYMMAIIINNINSVNIEMKEKECEQRYEESQSKNELVVEDRKYEAQILNNENNEVEIDNNNNNNNNNTGIKQFLNDIDDEW